MKKILNLLFEHKTLSREMARDTLVQIGQGRFNEHEVTAFMTVYLMRSIHIDELAGFREALLDLCLRVDIGELEAIDIVGTGGDGKNTFNISTLSCFLVAGAGLPVVKHGNYGASSISGSSNLMEQLGYRFSSDKGKINSELEAANISFLHAPLFHPALKQVASIRKNLGMRTFFNMLGPLVNPASPPFRLVGVFSLELARVYNYLFQQDDKPFTIIHGLDGYDEVSLTNDTRVITREGERNMSAEQLGKRFVEAHELNGGSSVEEAAKIFMRILSGKGSWAQNAVVIANAALALHSSGKFSGYDHCYNLAVESFESGKALGCLERLLSLQAAEK